MLSQQRQTTQPILGLRATAARFEALYELLARLAGQPSLALALDEVLKASLELVGADAGYIRMFDPQDVEPETSRFPFVAHAGISDAYIDYFSSLKTPVDPQARADVFHGRRVIIEDMFTHPSFAAHRDVVLAEGYRSMQATPLMSRNASRCVGNICTLFVESYTPPESAFETLDLYAEIAANAIEHHQQLAELADRDVMLTAVVDKQVAVLKHIQERVQLIEDRALSLDPEELRHVAHALRAELQQSVAEMSAVEAVGSNMPQSGTDSAANPYGLTPREMEVMAHAWRGLSDKQIAGTLGISRYTVAKHVSAGMRKMGVETRTQASVLIEREALFRDFAHD